MSTTRPILKLADFKAYSFRAGLIFLAKKFGDRLAVVTILERREPCTKRLGRVESIMKSSQAVV